VITGGSRHGSRKKGNGKERLKTPEACIPRSLAAPSDLARQVMWTSRQHRPPAMNMKFGDILGAHPETVASDGRN
jgi:hypothetical protein